MRKMSHNKSSSYWPYPAMSKRQYRRWRGEYIASETKDRFERYCYLEEKWFHAVNDSYK